MDALSPGTGPPHHATRPVHALILLVVCMAAFLPGIFSLPPTDRDEARFVQTTHQMAETGNHIDIRFQDEARYKKPIGIYWLQSAAIALTGRGADAPIWVYRLVSVAGATAAVLATGWIATFLFGSGAGLTAGLVQATILMLCFEARIAKTDAMLLSTVVFAQGALATVWIAHREGRAAGWTAPLVFWIATGAGILIKGPVTPMITLLTALSLAVFYRQGRWLRRLKPLVGIAIVLAIVAPWLILITLKSGGAFWSDSVGHDLLGKVGGAQESHGAPPGYYTLIFVVFMWPFGLMALRGGLRVLVGFRDDPRLAFLMAWYVPWWILVEALPTKLPHYMLPAYPAVITALAWSLEEDVLGAAFARRWQRWLEWLTLAGQIAATLALAGLAVVLPWRLTGAMSWAGMAAALTALAAGVLASGRVMRTQLRGAVALAAALSIVTFALLTGIVIPALKPIWMSPAIADAFHAEKPCSGSILTSAGYSEPSLVFLAGTKTRLTDGAGAAVRLKADPACAIAAVSDREATAFFAALPAGKRSVRALATIDGINYSKGDRTTVTLYRAARR